MNTVAGPQTKIDNGMSPGFIILCDMDGTLIDTDYANYLAYSRAIGEVTREKHDVKFDYRERLNRGKLEETHPLSNG